MQHVPQTFIVRPPVKAMPVPVLHDPTQSGLVLAQLKAGTAVQVVGETTLWLKIELPGSQYGYLQKAYARPATPEETLASKTEAASGSGQKQQAPILSTEAGLVRPRRRGNFGCAYSAFGLAFVSCVAGTILYSLERQECYYPAGNCVPLDHPLAAPAEVLMGIGFVVLLVGLIVWITAMLTTFRGRAR